MPTTQTNGIDTATFERREFTYEVSSETDAEVNATPIFTDPTPPPPVAGGQGRTARDVETTVDVLLLLAVVALSGVIVRVVGLLLIGG